MVVWGVGVFCLFFFLAVAKPSLAGRLKEAASLYSDDKKPGRGRWQGRKYRRRECDLMRNPEAEK